MTPTGPHTAPAPEGAEAPPADPRRWWVLALVSGLQFMILLDMTVVNVALPRIQESLGFTEAGLAWVVNGYVLMSGGLLLLGGRLADFFGRRRLLLTGVVVFAVSSIVCGAAVSPGMMVAGRLGQGIAEAIAAPASLGLIALLFTDPKERTKALGIWGGLLAVGGTLGYVISGVLTDLGSWRWIFYINVPVAVVVLVLVPRLVAESRMVREKDHRLDVTGAITSTAGLFGVFAGATMPAATTAALHKVTAQDSGLASGVQTTMQQIGSALGLAVLVTLALRYADDEIRHGVPAEVAVTSGYVMAFRVGAALMVLGGVLIMVLFERVDPDLRDPTAEMVEKTR